jgi:hypothetical protein
MDYQNHQKMDRWKDVNELRKRCSPHRLKKEKSVLNSSFFEKFRTLFVLEIICKKIKPDGQLFTDYGIIFRNDLEGGRYY